MIVDNIELGYVKSLVSQLSTHLLSLINIIDNAYKDAALSGQARHLLNCVENLSDVGLSSSDVSLFKDDFFEIKAKWPILLGDFVKLMNVKNLPESERVSQANLLNTIQAGFLRLINLEGRITSPFEEMSDEHLGMVQGRVLDLQNRVEALAEIVNNLEGARKQFDAAKDSVIKDSKIKLDNFIDVERASVQKIASSIDDFLEKKMLDVQAKSDDLDEVISQIASRALSGSFMLNAQKEEKSANRFRLYSLMLMSVVGFFFVVNFLFFELRPVDGNVLLNRLAAGLFFSFIVAYMIRQSAVHRAQQHQYLQKALDLNAITPYIATLPLEAQHAVKQLIAEKMFVPAAAQGSGDASQFGMQEIVGKIIDKMELPSRKN